MSETFRVVTQQGLGLGTEQGSLDRQAINPQQVIDKLPRLSEIKLVGRALAVVIVGNEPERGEPVPAPISGARILVSSEGLTKEVEVTVFPTMVSAAVPARERLPRDVVVVLSHLSSAALTDNTSPQEDQMAALFVHLFSGYSVRKVWFTNRFGDQVSVDSVFQGRFGIHKVGRNYETIGRDAYARRTSRP